MDSLGSSDKGMGSFKKRFVFEKQLRMSILKYSELFTLSIRTQTCLVLPVEVKNRPDKATGKRKSIHNRFNRKKSH